MQVVTVVGFTTIKILFYFLSYTVHTIYHFQYIKEKKICLNYPKSAAIGSFIKGLKDEFETALVNEPSVFEPLKFYCIYSV